MMARGIFLSFILLLLFSQNSYSQEIIIKAKINDDIITNLDILDEKQYLLFLNPNLKKLTLKDMEKISLNSLIKEIIKKNEVKKYFDLSKEYPFEKKVNKKLMKSKNFLNENKFKKYLNSLDLDYDQIKYKLKIESLWNQIIYNKYNKNIKIDKKYLKSIIQKEISKLEKKYELNLSELLFELKENENFEDKYLEIKNSIKNKGFKNTSIIYSITDTAKIGGALGWIKESQLSESIKKKINEVKIGEITKPIMTPNGYLIIKITDKKELQYNVDLEFELKQLIEFEKNKQLNQFSLNLFKRLKQNSIIYEY